MKMLKLIVRESSGNYIPPKLTLGTTPGSSIRDEVMAAGFEAGEEVVVITLADFLVLQPEVPRCGPGCQNGGKCFEP